MKDTPADLQLYYLSVGGGVSYQCGRQANDDNN